MSDSRGPLVGFHHIAHDAPEAVRALPWKLVGRNVVDISRWAYTEIHAQAVRRVDGAGIVQVCRALQLGVGVADAVAHLQVIVERNLP